MGVSAQTRWSETARIQSDNDGYNLGVSAMFAGACGDFVVTAGGANFPDKPVAEGGSKAFYDEIYLLSDSTWHYAGKLPEPCAYGMSATYNNTLICIGGANSKGSARAVYALAAVNADSVTVTPLPSLPYGLQEGAAAIVGSTVYVAGGASNGKASTSLLSLDLAATSNGWQVVANLPQAMIQPVMAALGSKLYLWAGYDNAARKASFCAYSYDTATAQWSNIAIHPEGGTFTGATAVALPDSGEILIVGGVNRLVFDRALNMSSDQSHEYLTRPVEAYRFQPKAWLYDIEDNFWTLAATDSCLARAGAMVVKSNHGVYLIGGELKPGIRTTSICLSTD